MRPNSSSGTSSAAKAGLSAADICAIIDACAKSRVSSLTYAGLEIKFDVAATTDRNPLEYVPVDQPEGGETPSGGSQGAATQAKVHLSEDDKTLMEELRLAQLMTDDPLAYEQEMIDSHTRPRGTGDSREDPG